MPNREKGNLPAGRPPKFDEPSRPVTVTLPERVLRQLDQLGPDRARAIVTAVERLVGAGPESGPPGIEVRDMAPGIGLLVVPHSESLAGVPWLRLIAIAPNRFLLTVRSGTPIEKVEVALMDLIAKARETGSAEVELLEELRSRIGVFRRGERLSKAEILVVERQPTDRDRGAGPDSVAGPYGPVSARHAAEELHGNAAGV